MPVAPKVSKTLVIAEKPSVAADLVKVLPGKFTKERTHYEGDEYIVSFAIGHLVTIAEPGEMNEKFKPWKLTSLPILPESYLLKPISSSKSQLSTLGKLIRKREVKTIINACDAGREGELIFRYIIEYVAKSKPIKKDIKRLWLQSMTTDAIKKAFQDLREGDELKALADAAICRSEADWLIGINGSRGLTSYNSRFGGFFLTPCGRVQTPTLSMIIRREQARLAFIPQEYWLVEANFKNGTQNYSGKWFREDFTKDPLKPQENAERIWSEKEATDIVSRVKGKDAIVEEQTKPSQQKSPPLYDLTSLQREANSRFGFSAKMTLNLAQALYEKYKVLTYPRTDSKCLPEDYLNSTKENFEKLSSGKLGKFMDKALKEGYVKPDKRIFNNAKISDHHAIIPTSLVAKSLPEAESKLYTMVLQRYIAVFYPAAKFLITNRITRVGEDSFKTDGKQMVEAGWKEIYGKSDSAEQLLPSIDKESKTHVSEIEAESDQTKPPARFNESSLLSAMESAGKLVDDDEMAEAMKDRGLGTPATRAAIIEKLLSDKYIVREGRELIPTRKAFDLLNLIFAMKIEALSSPELTGEWEKKLNEIEQGTLTREDFMNEIIASTQKIVDHIKGFDEEVTKTEANFSPFKGMKFYEYLDRFESEDGSVRIRKILGGRHMAEEEIIELMTERKIGPLDGFISKKGAPFSALIKMGEDNKVEFVFEDNNSGVDGKPLDISKETPIGASPVDDSPVYETLTGYISESALNNEKTGLRLNKIMLGKELGQENILKLLAGEKTNLIEGLRSSRTKRLFDAWLTLSKSGKITFSFPPRKTGGRKKPANDE